MSYIQCYGMFQMEVYKEYYDGDAHAIRTRDYEEWL